MLDLVHGRCTAAPTRRRLLSLAMCLLATLGLVSPARAEPRITVVQSGASTIYESVSTAIAKQLVDYCATSPSRCPDSYSLKIATLNDDGLPVGAVAATDLIITLGRRAALEISRERHSTPILFALIPRDTVDALPQCCKGDAPDRQQTALVLDQPLERQLRLIRESFPERARVGVLLSQTTAEDAPQLDRLARSLGLELTTSRVDDPDTLGSVLNELLDSVDLLLALPDPRIYNKRTIVSILLSSYRRSVPVIGFSKAYVKAGAVIALHSTPDQIGRQIADIVGPHLAHGVRLPATVQYPEYFEVAVNARVARSLGIRLPDDQALLSRLRMVVE